MTDGGGAVIGVLGRFVLPGLVVLGLVSGATAPAETEAGPHTHPSAGTVQATVCSLVDGAARANHVPVALLTRLIWTESRFRAGAVSPKGAQGIAQFMPATAAERGLADPFDPEQAVPKAARLVADLTRRFGNVGLAAAAYNAGADRVSSWLAGSGGLPAETQAYVISVTGIPAEDWKRVGAQAKTGDDVDEGESCDAVTALLRTEEASNPIPIAPWGVQLAGNFSKAIALASFARAAQRYQRIIGETQPMVVYGVVRSRGRLPFYRVMIPKASRADAVRTCQSILAIGGACVALRS
jgi:soluble lytic murein transglycosylase-like protein